MSTLDDLHITEGRAYHAGDVVLVRSKRPLTGATIARITETLSEVGRDTGVRFVLLEQDVEVVEPSAEAELRRAELALQTIWDYPDDNAAALKIIAWMGLAKFQLEATP